MADNNTSNVVVARTNWRNIVIIVMAIVLVIMLIALIISGMKKKSSGAKGGKAGKTGKTPTPTVGVSTVRSPAPLTR